MHKQARLTEDHPGTGMKKGDLVSLDLFQRLLEEEYEKLQQASNRDVYDDSKSTTLPVTKIVVDTYVKEKIKIPWYIDLLNINLNNHDLEEAEKRILLYLEKFRKDGTRITENLDFNPPVAL